MNNEESRREYITWDTGTTTSIVTQHKLLSRSETHSQVISTGTGSQASSIAKGTLRLSDDLEQDEVWLIPSFSRNLLSIGKICDQGNRAIFTATGARIVQEGTNRVLGVAKRKRDGLYEQKLHDKIDKNICFVNNAPTLHFYHCLLGHPNEQLLRKWLKALNIKYAPQNGKLDCEACAKGKLKERRMKRKREYDNIVGGKWHIDTAGPLPLSIDDYQYFTVVIDENSRKCIDAILLTLKSDVGDKLKKLIRKTKLNDGISLYCIRTDGAGEFASENLLTFLNEMGITKEECVRHTHVELAERIIQTLKNMARCLLAQANLGTPLWTYAVKHAVTLYNNTPHAGINFKSPNEAYGSDPLDIRKLGVFGSKAHYVHPDEQRRKGISSVGRECIWLGTQGGSPLIFDVKSRKHGRLCRTIQIHQGRFLSRKEAKDLGIGNSDNHRALRNPTDVPMDYVPDTQRSIHSNELDDSNGEQRPKRRKRESGKKERPKKTRKRAGIDNDSTLPSDDSPRELRRSKRKRPKVSYVETPDEIDWCFLTNSIWTRASMDPDFGSIEKIADTIFNGMNHQLGSDEIEMVRHTAQHALLQKYLEKRLSEPRKPECMHTWTQGGLTLLNTEPDLTQEEPSSFMSAMTMACWREAIDAEIDSINEHKVYELVELPPHRKPLQSTWVFKIKRTETGEIERYKARLCIKGFRQKQGIDFHLTFAPVGSKTALRMFLAHACSSKMILRHWDVKTAFLNGELEEEIFMRQPQGMDDGSGRVWKLLKGLYGLKQAPRIWFIRIKKALLKLGFKQSTTEPCIFFSDNVIIFVYVDDLLVASHNEEELSSAKQVLFQEFTMKDLGFPKKFLGCEVHQVSDGIILAGERHIENLLKQCGMDHSRPVSTPMDAGFKCEPTDATMTPSLLVKKYQQTVGSLLWLAMNVRPDITLAVSVLSKYMANPREKHWNAAKRIMRYLNGTKDHGLLIKSVHDEKELISYVNGQHGSQAKPMCPICKTKCSGSHIKIVTDADYAMHWSRKSRTGYCCYYKGTLVAWRSKLQNVVALSTCESELYAMVDGSKDLEFMKKLDYELVHRRLVEDHMKLTNATVWCEINQLLLLSKKRVPDQRLSSILVLGFRGCTTKSRKTQLH